MAHLPADFQTFFLYQGDLGQGSFGRVVRAVDRATGESCAVKIIDKSSVRQECARELAREVDILSSLSHPNIIHFLKTYETPTSLYLVMELVSGGTLTELLAVRKLTESEAARVIKGILHAVAYLHSKDIVHRDLKPDNILIPSDFDLSLVKVIDFGLSDESSDATYRPMTSECGTLLFVAPEQIQHKHYGKAIDVWSCGIILHMVCTGGLHPLWTDEDSAETYREKLGKLEWKLGEMSHLALSLFTRLTKFDPIQRYSPMQALAHPWILRRQSTVPLTSLEKIQQFNSELHLRKMLFAIFFLSATTLSSTKENESWEPTKRRGRSSHPGLLRLPPISKSPVKSRDRHSVNGGVIKPKPVVQAKQAKSVFL